MKMMRKVCSVFLCVILLFGVVPVFSSAAGGESFEISDSGFAVVDGVWLLMLHPHQFTEGAKGIIRLSYNPKVLEYNDIFYLRQVIKQVSEGVLEITFDYDGAEETEEPSILGPNVIPFSVIGKGDLGLSMTYDLKTQSGKTISQIQTVNSLTDSISYNENELPSFSFRDGTGWYYEKMDELFIAKPMTVFDLRAAYTGDPSTLLVEDYKGNPLSDNAPVATGTTLVIVFHGEMVSTAAVVLLGDCDADGKITSADASSILQIAVGVYPGIYQESPFDDESTNVQPDYDDEEPVENDVSEYDLLNYKEMAADVDYNGEVTTDDARKILRCASGIEKYDSVFADLQANNEFYDHLNTLYVVYVEMKRNYSAPDVMYNRDYFDNTLVAGVQVVKEPVAIGNLVLFGRLGLMLELWKPTAENAEQLRAELASRSDIESVTVESESLSELNYYAKAARAMAAKR